MEQLLTICPVHKMLNSFLEDRYNEVFGGNMGVNMGALVHKLNDTIMV